MILVATERSKGRSSVITLPLELGIWLEYGATARTKRKERHPLPWLRALNSLTTRPEIVASYLRLGIAR